MPRACLELVKRGRSQGMKLISIGIALLTLVAAAHSQLMLLVTGLLGETYDVQGSNNLQNWTLVSSLVNTNGTVEVAQQPGGGFSFYRVLVTSPGSSTSVAQRAGLALYFAAGTPLESQVTRVASEEYAMKMLALQRAANAPQEVEPLFTSFAATAAVEAIRKLPPAETSQARLSDAAAQAVRRIIGVCSNALPGFPGLDTEAYGRMLGTGAGFGTVIGAAMRRVALVSALQTATLAAQKTGGTPPSHGVMTPVHASVYGAVPSGAVALQNAVFTSMKVTAALPPPPPSPPPSGGGGGGLFGGFSSTPVVPGPGGNGGFPPTTGTVMDTTRSF